MSRRDAETPLRQMLDHAREAEQLVRGRNREGLGDDREFELALVRLLEVVGEAANRVPEGVQERHEDIPWAEIVGLRNRLIHAYDAVDHDIVWRIATVDIPDLVKDLERVVEEEASGDL